MTIEEKKKAVIKNIKWQPYPKSVLGGQSCGLSYKGVTLKSEELNFEVTVNTFNSQLKNKEIAFTLFELLLDDVLK